ncbi:MAG: hypothetical protein J7518_09985 [Nocardioidaceae bacterium]|nr:hypothetical protein [Nocardioidaceae bacterium]
MRKTAILTAGLLLGASLLGGCGGGDDKGSSSKGYCDLLKDSQSELNTLSGNDVPDAKEFEKFLDRADDLAKEAPAAVKDDWKVLDGTLDDLQKALDDAGITLQQLSEAASGKMPEGLDASKLQALGTKLQGLSSEKLTKATAAIQKHAKDECGVDLDDATN